MPRINEYRFPADRLYESDSHLWIQDQGETVYIGIDDFEQEVAGTYQRLMAKEPGTEISAGDELVNVESAKFVGSKAAPVSGTVREVNMDVIEDPTQINTAPYESWLVELEPDTDEWQDGLISDEEIESWAQSEIDEEKRRTTATEEGQCLQD